MTNNQNEATFHAGDFFPEGANPDGMLKAKKMLLYMGIFSIVMMFAGLISAFVVSRTGSFWVHLKAPQSFYISTVLIIMSSLTFLIAKKKAMLGIVKQAKMWILFTLILGVGFAYFQMQGWGELNAKGNFVNGKIQDLKGDYGDDFIVYNGETALELVNGSYYSPNDKLQQYPLDAELGMQNNDHYAYLKVMTWLHVVHLIGGLAYLLLVVFLLFVKKFKPRTALRIKLCGQYWHFLGFLWLFLFAFLFIIH